MKSGMKAGTVLIVALIITAAFGFLTATEMQDVERTSYSRVSDLTPVVIGYDVDSYVPYNPNSNVTGWEDRAGTTIPYIMNGASPYPKRFYDSTESTTYTTPIKVSNISATTQPSASVELARWWAVGNAVGLGSSDTVTVNDYTVSRTSAGAITIERTSGNTIYPISISVTAIGSDGSVGHTATFTFRGNLITNTDAYVQSYTATQFDTLASQIISPYRYVSIDIGARSDGSYIVGIMTYRSWIDAFQNSDDALDLLTGTATAFGQDTARNVVLGGGLTQTTTLSGNETGQVNWSITMNGTALSTAQPFSYISLAQLLSYNNVTLTDNLTISSPTAVIDGQRTAPIMYGNDTYTGGINSNGPYGTHTLDLSTFQQRLTYDEDTDRWYPAVMDTSGRYYIPDTSKVGYSGSQVFLTSEGWVQSFSIDVTSVTFTYRYVDPMRYVSVTSGQEVWSNGYQNGLVRLLASTSSASAIYWYGEYKSTDGEITAYGIDMTLPSIPYNYCLITVDLINQEIYAQGIVNQENPPNPFNYEVRPYRYTPAYDVIDLDNDQFVSNLPSYITSIQVSNRNVAIAETSVQLDPQGYLWGDPSLALGYWFSDRFSSAKLADQPMRVQFNSFITYGDSLTVNGITMSVSDGRLAVPVTENGTTHPEYVELKGMSIDWQDGHVWIRQNSQTYDMGAYDTSPVTVKDKDGNTLGATQTAYMIQGTGVWYWASNLYSIDTSVVQEAHLDLSKGIQLWSMSVSTTALLFCAMLIIGAGLFTYFYRDEGLSALDWVIILCALLIALGVAVM